MKLQAGIALLGCFYGTASAACTDNTKSGDCKGDSEGVYECVWLWKTKTCKSDGYLECSDFNGAKKQCLENGSWDCFFNNDTKECTEDRVDCSASTKKKRCEKNADCSWTSKRCMHKDDLSSCGTFDNWRWGCLKKSSPASGSCSYTKNDTCVSDSSMVASDFDGMGNMCRKMGFELVKGVCQAKAAPTTQAPTTPAPTTAAPAPKKKCYYWTNSTQCFAAGGCFWVDFLGGACIDA